MKRIILIVLLLESLPGFGQFEMPKGSKQKGIAGSINISSNEVDFGYTNDTFKSTNTILGSFANISWFIANNMSVGLANSISLYKTAIRYKSSGEIWRKSSSHTFNIGLPIRYYLKNGLFGEASPGVTIYNSSFSVYYLNARFSIGYAALIAPNMAIEPILSYTRSYSSDQIDPENLFQFGIGLSYYKRKAS